MISEYQLWFIEDEINKKQVGYLEKGSLGIRFFLDKFLNL